MKCMSRVEVCLGICALKVPDNWDARIVLVIPLQQLGDNCSGSNMPRRRLFRALVLSQGTKQCMSLQVGRLRQAPVRLASELMTVI